MSSSSKESKSRKSGSSCKNVCPISLMNEKEMTDDTKFKVCPDPTIYDVDSLAHWVFDQGNDTYPHNRMKILPDDKKRLKRMWKNLHPSPVHAQVVVPPILNVRTSPSQPSRSTRSYSSNRSVTVSRSSESVEPPEIEQLGLRDFETLRSSYLDTRTIYMLDHYFKEWFSVVVLYDVSTQIRVAHNFLQTIEKILDVQIISTGNFDRYDGFHIRINILCKGLSADRQTMYALYCMEEIPILNWYLDNSIRQWKCMTFPSSLLHRYPSPRSQIEEGVREYVRHIQDPSDNILYYAENLARLREFEENNAIMPQLRRFIRMRGGGKKKKNAPRDRF